MANQDAVTDAQSQQDAALLVHLREMGYRDFRWIDGRGWCGLHDYMFTCGIVIGLSESSYTGRYCYPDRPEAFREFSSWNGLGDPGGNWVKYKSAREERLGPGATDDDRNFWNP